MSNMDKPPDWFPLLWHEIVKNGGGRIPCIIRNFDGEVKPSQWTPQSIERRFQAFIRVLRTYPLHSLHGQAIANTWGTKIEGDYITIKSRLRTNKEFERWKRSRRLNRKY